MSDRIVLRPARAEDAAGIALVHFETSRQSLRGILPDSVLDCFTREKRLNLWRGLFGQAGNWPLVEVAVRDPAEVVGFAWWRRVTAAPSTFDAEIINIYVRPAEQRRGLGRRLLIHTAARMAEAGARSCYLWVFDSNLDARRLYESLSAKLVDRGQETHGTLQIPTLAYAWKPIDDLIAATGAGDGEGPGDEEGA